MTQDIGRPRRHVRDMTRLTDAAGGDEAKDFVSGCSAAVVPKLWDLSRALRAAP
jgi:hypothetical protein